MKAVKEKVRKYYKYVYEPWTQPGLTANGTMGGSSPSASASSVHGSYDGQPWRAFNGMGTGSSGWASNNVAPPQWIMFYNPTAFCLQSFTITNRAHCWTSFILQVSNDGSNFTGIESYNNDNLVTDSSWTKTVSIENQNMYKYYRFYITSTSTSTDTDVKQIELFGSIRSIADGTEQDYDFYKDVPIYKIIKQNDIYKAPRSWEKGQYYGI